GGLVGAAYGNTTLKQCENYGKITGHAAAGLVGRVDKVPLSEYDFEKKTHYTVESEVLFEACANHGVISDAGCKDLTVKEGNAEVIKTSGHLGGLLAHGTATTITFRGCTNTADILQENTGIDTGMNSVLKADGSRDEAKEHQGDGKAAGIAAYIEQSSSEYHVDVYFYNCRNTGNVTGWSHTGGFAGNIKGGTHVFGGENSGTVRSRGSYAAGFVAAPTTFYVNTGYTHDFFDCINTGDVISHRLYAGGIFAYSLDRLNMSRCLNAGNVSAQGVSATTQNEDHHLVLCAGIVAYLENRVTLSHCVNTGKIVSNQAAAGIFGKVGVVQSPVSTDTYSSFISCFQSGNVTVYARDNGVVLTEDLRYTLNNGKQAFRYYWSDYHAAGILGFSWGNWASGAPHIVGCGVMGNISTDWGAACGFLGYSNTQYLLIQYNYFLGTLKGPGETELMHQVTLRTDYATEYVLTWNDRWDGQKYLRNNYCYADVADKYMLMQNNGEDVGFDGYEYFVTKEDVTSGRLAYLLDEAILKDYENMGMNFLSYVAQDLSGTGETHPTSPYYFLLLSDAERREVIGYGKAVVKNGDGYGNADLMIETEPPKDDPDTTTDAEITTEPDVSTDTEVTTSDHDDVTTAPDPDATAAPESDPSDGTGEVPDSGCGSVIG
ncbi:MAG: hypothetical protein J6B77_00910, partial [Clostridia bacterium]|nr:hypothetical protein [Clostridia bacterium]